jgi:geranylgeranyl pyrophosphate synthase
MPALDEVGRRILHDAHLAPPVAVACHRALTQPGHLFSASPRWARLFLVWIDALAPELGERALPAAVACECLAAGFDLIDDVHDLAGAPYAPADPDDALAAGVTLLLVAQEALAHVGVPLERRECARAALGRASRRVVAAQAWDDALRRLPMATQDEVLAVMYRRSGTLVAAPCQCAALLAGTPWRVVALAGRFGRALGCAAQLEDDLADLAEDAQNGRKTLPIILARLYPDAPEMVEATTWVLMQRFAREAAQTLRRLPAHIRTEPLWTLLPATARASLLS